MLIIIGKDQVSFIFIKRITSENENGLNQLFETKMNQPNLIQLGSRHPVLYINIVKTGQIVPSLGSPKKGVVMIKSTFA